MSPRRILIWHWGKRGAGPRFAVELAAGLNAAPDVTVLLSLSRQAEILQNSLIAQHMPIDTYTTLPGFAARIATIPFALPGLMRRLHALRPDLAICAMPAPLDMLMGTALRLLRIPYWVVVHDADSHPGDGMPFQMWLQRHLMAHAAGLITLSTHVTARLRDQGVRTRVIQSSHPPFAFGPKPPPPRTHGGPLRLLFFGRLLPYKGLDLFVDTLRLLGPRDDVEIRVAGRGPDSPALTALRGLPHVSVDQRWIPEAEIGALLAWADALVLSHVEASQSGVAAAAIAAGRWVVATNVGGLTEQLAGLPQARLCAPTPDALATGIKSLILDPPAGIAPSGIASGTEWTHTAAALARDLETTSPQP